jgi:hypothetical protein
MLDDHDEPAVEANRIVELTIEASGKMPVPLPSRESFLISWAGRDSLEAVGRGPETRWSKNSVKGALLGVDRGQL